MANTTVYPFGTNGTMPSSVGIVNDLTTGGVNKALSAEMGKVLNGKIMVSVAKDYIIIQNLSFNAQGFFAGGDNNNLVGYLPVQSGEEYLVNAKHITNSTQIRVGFSQAIPAVGGSVDVVFEASSQNTDQSVNVVAPYDGYLVFRWYYGYYTMSVDYLPPIKTAVEDNTNKIDEIYKTPTPQDGVMYKDTALNEQGEWGTASGFDIYHFTLANGFDYNAHQQEGRTNTVRLFQVTESNGETIYTQVQVFSNEIFNYSCPNDGNTYLLQMPYYRGFGGNIPKVYKLVVTPTAVTALYEKVSELEDVKYDDLLVYSGHTSTECINRFITEMQSRITNMGYNGSGLTSPWGSSTNYLPIDALVKYTAEAMAYNFLCELYAETTHIAKTSLRTVTINSTTYTNAYVGDYINNYIPLVHKTGSSGTTANFTCACVEPTSREVLVGTIITSAYQMQSESINRYKCMKILLDIGTARLANPSADVSALEAQLVDQKIVSAIVIRIPKCNPLALHHLVVGDASWLLYGYNRTSVLTYSTIKLLSAQIMMDYLGDKLESEILVDSDDATCAEISGLTLTVGEKWKVRDLIYAILLDSSNQATKAVAKRVGAILLDKYT